VVQTPMGATGSILEQSSEIEQVRRQRALTLYNEAKRLSDEALAGHQYPAAIAQAQQAIDIINQNRTVFSDIEADALRDAAARQLSVAQTQAETWRIEEQNRARIEAARLDQARASALQEQRRRQVNTLIQDADRLVQVSQFQQAADLLRQATVIDPQNDSARLNLRLVEDKINDRAYEELQHKRGVETIRQQIDSTEHLIPYADLMVYPDNWVEITRRRIGTESGQESARNRATRDKLEEALLRQLFPNPEAEDEVGEGVSLWLADGIVVLRTRLNRNQ